MRILGPIISKSAKAASITATFELAVSVSKFTQNKADLANLLLQLSFLISVIFPKPNPFSISAPAQK
jgi:hypothetical protein